MDALKEIAEKYDVKILEDVCQAHGASYKGRKIGSIGNASAFSFYPSKNMTVCGDGGMLTTNDEKIAETARSLRDNGRTKENAYLHQYIGFTARMNTVNAAIGNVQLSYLDKWVKKKRKIAKLYRKMLNGIDGLTLPMPESADIKPADHLYVIRSDLRDALMHHLKSKDIECGVHYPIPIHLQPPYRAMGFKEGMFPNAEECANKVLSIPIHQGLDTDKVEYIASAVREFFTR